MKSGNNLSEIEFIRKAIKQLREQPNKGIHNKYSGFNDAFREYFDKDPLEALQRFEKQGKVVKEPVRDGWMLYLPSDAPEKSITQRTIEKIISGDSGEQSSKTEKPATDKQSSKKWIPLVVDDEGAHETTEYALTSGPKRVWLKEFSDGGRKIKLKSVYISKEDVKKMDRIKTEWSWDQETKSWEINADNLAYVIDHFVNLNYDIAVSPSLSHLIIEDLPLNVEYLEEVEQEGAEPIYEGAQPEEKASSRTRKKVDKYKVKKPTTKNPDDELFINKARANIKKPMSKLTPIDVMNIWDRLESGKNYKSVSKDYPVSSGTINGIRNKDNWSWLTDAIQTGNKEKYKGILSTLNYLILFKEKEEIDKTVVKKALKRVDLYDTKLSPLDVIDIWERLELGDDPDYIAEDYPVGPGAIKNIKHGSNWTWLTDKLSGGDNRKYKRFIKSKLIEEGKTSERANFEKYKILDKKFVKRAWEKLYENSFEFPAENVIDIWEEFESGKTFGEIAREHKVDRKQVKNICLKDTFEWLTKKLGKSDNEKYRGMIIALEESIDEEEIPGKLNEEDETKEEEKNYRQKDGRSRDVLRFVKSQYNFNDSEKEVDNPKGNKVDTDSSEDSFKPGDIVEHSLGMKGKVQKIEGGTLLVKVGPHDSRKWMKKVCTFVKEGK